MKHISPKCQEIKRASFKREQFLQQCYKHDVFLPLRKVITGFNCFYLVPGEHELTLMQAVTAQQALKSQKVQLILLRAKNFEKSSSPISIIKTVRCLLSLIFIPILKI